MIDTYLSAAEIVQRFREETGHELHPTNAGHAAKKLGLEYIVVEVSVPGIVAYKNKRRLYLKRDLPKIFAHLSAKLG